MQKQIQDYLENKEINEILPITLIKNSKINLFYGKQDKVSYLLSTDGIINHLDTWMDKRPWDRDIFLKSCGVLKRFELELTNSNILLIEKRREDLVLKQLYINQDLLENIINNNGYQISVNAKENLMIKKLEKIL